MRPPTMVYMLPNLCYQQPQNRLIPDISASFNPFKSLDRYVLACKIGTRVLPSLAVYDANGNLVTNASLTSQSGFSPTVAVPEPSNLLLIDRLVCDAGFRLQIRLYSSVFYALRNTRTPLKFAVLRVALTLALGYVCALPLPRLLGLDHRWGTAGLTLSAGIAGWLEFVLLRRALHRQIGVVPFAGRRVARLWLVALIAATVALHVLSEGH
jgi:hypothetical protein